MRERERAWKSLADFSSVIMENHLDALHVAFLLPFCTYLWQNVHYMREDLLAQLGNKTPT